MTEVPKLRHKLWKLNWKKFVSILIKVSSITQCICNLKFWKLISSTFRTFWITLLSRSKVVSFDWSTEINSQIMKIKLKKNSWVYSIKVSSIIQCICKLKFWKLISNTFHTFWTTLLSRLKVVSFDWSTKINSQIMKTKLKKIREYIN